MSSQFKHSDQHQEAVLNGSESYVPKLPAVLKAKLQDYKVLVKFRLTVLVVFSTAMGFFLGMPAGSVDWSSLIFLMLGGFLIVGSANTINQIIERESDALMERTQDRPLAQNRMKVQEAAVLAMLMGLAGVIVMGLLINFYSASLALLGLLIYAFAYTPLKKITPIAVFVGGISGAIPPLAGFVAASGEITPFAISLFAIQFFWQFPHFWAIAWLKSDDYKRAGIKLLPLGSNKDRQGALQILMFTIVLLPLSILPTQLGFVDLWAGITALVLSALFTAQSFNLFYKLTDRAALMLMFGSFLYLPLILIVFLVSKLFI